MMCIKFVGSYDEYKAFCFGQNVEKDTIGCLHVASELKGIRKGILIFGHSASRRSDYNEILLQARQSSFICLKALHG